MTQEQPIQPPSTTAESSVASLVNAMPQTIPEIEAARAQVLESPEDFRAFESAFYDKFSGDEQSQGLSAAIGRYLLGQEMRAGVAIGDQQGEVPSFLRARIALNKGHFAAAAARVDEVLAANSSVLAARVIKAESLCQLGDEEALTEQLQAIENDHPDSTEVPYVHALLEETQGNYEEAARLYHQTLVMAPDHPGALFRLAYHESLRGDTEAAIENYERLTRGKPVHVGALINLGLLLEDDEEYGRASSCFQRVLDFDPTHWQARLYLKDAVASRGMYYDEERERTEDKRAQILRIPVTDFELSVRSRNCLANMNVRTLGDLIRLTEQELLSFKNFGETSLAEIKAILSQKGLRLGMLPKEDSRVIPQTVAEPADRDSAVARPVEDLDLSVRSRKALDNLGIRTVGDLASTGEAQLLACKNFGQTSLVEIKKKLADMGLDLAS